MSRTQANIEIFFLTEFELIEFLVHKIQLIRLCNYIKFCLENKLSKANLV